MDASIEIRNAGPAAKAPRRKLRHADRAFALVLSGAATLLLGCSGDTSGLLSAPQGEVYTTLTLDQRAITLALTAAPGAALYNTVQLSAIARAADGTALAMGDNSVHYSDPDSSITISPTGLVTAHYLANGTQVVASLTLNGVTHTDTAVIRVTETPLTNPLAKLSIQPMPMDLDSAADAVDDGGASINNGSGNIPVYAVTTGGDSVCSNTISCKFVVNFTTSDPTIATIDQRGFVTPVFPGRVQFVVSAMAYGVSKADTLHYVIGYPISNGTVRYLPSAVTDSTPSGYDFFPPEVRIGVGGAVTIQNFRNRDSLDVTITSSDAIIGEQSRWIGRYRQAYQAYIITQPGSYRYYSTYRGGSGIIRVISNNDL